MIEADSARHARQLLRGKELIPVHIEARMNTSSGGMLQRRRHAHPRYRRAGLDVHSLWVYGLRCATGYLPHR